MNPTIVLVHGAFADSSSWNGVIERLQQAGYPVVAVANPLRGLRSDAAYLSSVLAGIVGPVVLVGHSYGGSVISTAATGNPDVRALVYIAAFLPDEGESALELTTLFPGSTLPPAVEAREYPLPGSAAHDGAKGTELTIQPEKFHTQFAADLPVAIADLMKITQRPVSTRALEEKATTAAWRTIPSWALITNGDLNIPPTTLRFMAARAGSTIEDTDASHAVTVSRPDVVSDLILQAARTTDRQPLPADH